MAEVPHVEDCNNTARQRCIPVAIVKQITLYTVSAILTLTYSSVLRISKYRASCFRTTLCNKL